jgi:hypothetical protein
MSYSRVILDLDDFCEENSQLILLDELKEEIPQLRVTLFTIPGLTSSAWLADCARRRPWMRFVPHGYMHHTARECQHWAAKETMHYLRWLRTQLKPSSLPWIDCSKTTGVYEHGFKAPGWQISDDTFVILEALGFWIADQDYNRDRRPPGLRYYELAEASTQPHTFPIHGHIGHLGGHNANELELILPEIRRHKDADFQFVQDNLSVHKEQNGQTI